MRAARALPILAIAWGFGTAEASARDREPSAAEGHAAEDHAAEDHAAEGEGESGARPPEPAPEGDNAANQGEPPDAGGRAPARGEPADADPDAAAIEAAGSDEGDPGLFSLSIQGGLMAPRADFGGTRDLGLTAGLAFGLTASSGLGAAMSAEYAPLAPAGEDGDRVRETHVGNVTLTPRFTLGSGTLRAWVGGGGGLLVDYEEREAEAGETESDVVYAPMAAGAAGLELYAFDSGGFALTGRYGRSFRDGPLYEVITASAGLVLGF